MNLDLSGRLLLWPFGVVVVVSGWFSWFSRKLA